MHVTVYQILLKMTKNIALFRKVIYNVLPSLHTDFIVRKSHIICRATSLDVVVNRVIMVVWLDKEANPSQKNIN